MFLVQFIIYCEFSTNNEPTRYVQLFRFSAPCIIFCGRHTNIVSDDRRDTERHESQNVLYHTRVAREEIVSFRSREHAIQPKEGDGGKFWWYNNSWLGILYYITQLAKWKKIGKRGSEGDSNCNYLWLLCSLLHWLTVNIIVYVCWLGDSSTAQRG